MSRSTHSGLQRKYEIKTVVIDAGHGGHDTGCLGASAKEKDIALEISLKLGKLIQENYPDVKVVYTRKTDVFVELHERADIANNHKADLFICIHANSGGNAYGTETFVLGLHRAEENLAVSRRENSAILMEKDYKTKYDGFDPNSPEANIIFRLFQNTYLQQSLLFAAKVQDQLNDYAGRLNRGVKQAGLLVLARTSMPGVLIETGFLTNRNEEKYLMSSKGQTQIATAIYRAFKEYKIDMEESPDGKIAETPVETPLKDIPPPKQKEVRKDTSLAHQDSNMETHNPHDPIPPSKNTLPKSNKAENANGGKVPTEKPAVKKDSTASVKPKPSGTVANGTGPRVIFTVQLGAATKPTSKDRDRYKKVEDLVERDGEDGMTRFTAGNYTSLDRAILAQNEMRTRGFKDAFVTAYSREKRITIKEALELLKNKP